MRGRVAAALKAVVGIFDEGSATQAHGLLRGIWPGGIGDAPTAGARERVGAFADLPWLHALADKVASSFAAVDWTLAYPRGRASRRPERAKALQRARSAADRRVLWKRLAPEAEMVEVREHPMLDLLDGGNAMMTGLAVRYVTSLHLDLEGEAFWLKERNGAGAPVAAWPLPPDWVRSTPTPSAPAYRMSFRGWQGSIPETEVLWLPRHNPSNPYGRGTGLGRALADELETDEYAAKTTRQSFLNMNRPDFIVSPGEDGRVWGEPERRRLQEDWNQQHEGFWRAFRGRFSSQKLAVHEFTPTDMRHMQMVQLREWHAEQLRKIWGVPPEIMGIVEPGASRATAKLASYIFARWVLVPRLEAFRALLQERLVPEYDDRLVLDYVSPVEEDDDYALEVGTAAPWAPTVDEWRARGGLPPLPDGRGERHVLPPGVRAVADFEPEVIIPFPAPAEPDMAALLAADERRVLRWLAGTDRAR